MSKSVDMRLDFKCTEMDLAKLQVLQAGSAGDVELPARTLLGVIIVQVQSIKKEK